MVWPYRNSVILFLLLAGLLIISPAGAEMLTGTVVSVAERSFQLQDGTRTDGRIFRVVFAPARARNKPHGLGRPYPYCVREGRSIRLRGRFDPEKNIFFAEEIRGCPGRGKHHDPTGVRARLGRCMNPRAMP